MPEQRFIRSQLKSSTLTDLISGKDFSDLESFNKCYKGELASQSKGAGSIFLLLRFAYQQIKARYINLTNNLLSLRKILSSNVIFYTLGFTVDVQMPASEGA